MKTIRCFLIFFVLCSPMCLLSQEEPVESTSRDAKRRVVPALKFGFTRSNVYDRQGEEFVADGKTGWGAGAAIGLPLGSFLGIQPEVLLLQKGFEGAGRVQGESYHINRTTTHIDIPLQLQIKPFRWFTFFIGPQWSFMLSKKDSYQQGSNTIARQRIEENGVRESLFGTLTGVDLNFGHVILGLRSGWDVSTGTDGSNSDAMRYRNRWLFWNVAYRFY